jgi:hypothetical protein
MLFHSKQKPLSELVHRAHRCGAAIGAHDWRERKVREWLLLLLRFAVTREPADQLAVLAMAEEIDSLGLWWRPVAPRFFLRTSSEVCTAILAVGDGQDNAVLRRHAARIDDARLRRALCAAVGLQPTLERRLHNVQGSGRTGRDLWKGLPKK